MAVAFTTSALKEMLDMSSRQHERLARDLTTLTKSPEAHNLDVKKLQSSGDHYRLRIGEWRVFFTWDSALVVLGIRRRNDKTYTATKDLFGKNPGPIELSDDIELPPEMDPDRIDQELAEGFDPLPGELLPRQLTPKLLAQWQIPARYHADFHECETVEDLLDLSVVEPKVIEHVMDMLYPSSIEVAEGTAKYVIENLDDLEAYAAGRITKLLLQLDDEQLKMVDYRLEGPSLIRGGPGTGKTIVALYRVLELATRNPKARILFATYTRTLARYAEELLTHLLSERGLEVNLEVRTIDSVVRKHAGKTDKIANDGVQRSLLVDLLKHETDPLLIELGAGYLLEEFEGVIEAWGINSREEYLSAPRAGRVFPLYPEDRTKVWRVYTAWKAKLKAERLMTWNQLRRVALDRTKPGYDAVFVDEAQDLPPVAIRFLTKIAKSPQGIFLTADANQSIYQRDFSWKMVDSALDMRGKTAILKRDYRTTKAIHAAVENVAVKLGLDQDGFPEPGRREGPRPRLVALQGTNPFDKLAQEITQACRQARLPLGAVAVLAPTNALINSTITELNSRGIDAFHAKEEELELDHPAVKVLSLQSAKGMEFPIVFVTGIERGVLPRMVRDTPSEELAVHREQDARLFFVACSRAMRMLVVTYSAHCPSEFVTELDESAWEHVGAVAS